MNVAPMDVRSRSFDGWAEEYERFRPGYPRALFERIASAFELPEHPAAVDLGAGTGKVARALAAMGWQVTAVEPGPRMIEVMRRAAAAEHVEVEAVERTAEDTGLESARFDVATAGEAWHWFDAPRALAEIARILKRGGGFAFFWNVVDEARIALVRDERRITEEYGIGGEDTRQPGPRPETRAAIRSVGAFDEPEFVQVQHVVEMTAAQYVGLEHTKSHVRTAPAEVQTGFGRALQALMTRHGIGPDDRLEVPYVVDCWLARRTAS